VSIQFEYEIQPCAKSEDVGRRTLRLTRAAATNVFTDVRVPMAARQMGEPQRRRVLVVRGGLILCKCAFALRMTPAPLHHMREARLSGQPRPAREIAAPIAPRAAILGSLSFSFTATAPDCGGGAAVAEVADDAPLDGFGAFGGRKWQGCFCWKRLIHRNGVDLPAPDRPMIPTIHVGDRHADAGHRGSFAMNLIAAAQRAIPSSYRILY
jgi:hypothetical protein